MIRRIHIECEVEVEQRPMWQYKGAVLWGVMEDTSRGGKCILGSSAEPQGHGGIFGLLDNNPDLDIYRLVYFAHLLTLSIFLPVSCGLGCCLGLPRHYDIYLYQ